MKCQASLGSTMQENPVSVILNGNHCIMFADCFANIFYTDMTLVFVLNDNIHPYLK